MADLPRDVPDLPEAVRELFGYVVREAVTNVVRHSEASRCAVVLTPDRVEITDDGVGRGTGSGGSGLRGLAARVEAAGGRLVVESAPGVGTRVAADLTRKVEPVVGTS